MPNNPSSAQPVPDPAADLPLDRVRLRLIGRFGFKDDELDVLFPSEAELREAYRQALVASSSEANSQDNMEEGDDDYRLSSAESVRLLVDEASRRESVAGKKTRKQMENQSAFPADAQVTEEEASATQKALADLNLDELDDDELDDDEDEEDEG